MLVSNGQKTVQLVNESPFCLRRYPREISLTESFFFLYEVFIKIGQCLKRVHSFFVSFSDVHTGEVDSHFVAKNEKKLLNRKSDSF